MSTQEQIQEADLTENQVGDLHEIVLHNDDVNTFEHVTAVLMKVCKHSHEQAEQCTLIIHYKGKCAVKKGTRPELKPLCEAILDEGIQAAIL